MEGGGGAYYVVRGSYISFCKSCDLTACYRYIPQTLSPIMYLRQSAALTSRHCLAGNLSYVLFLEPIVAGAWQVVGAIYYPVWFTLGDIKGDEGLSSIQERL